MLTGGSQYGTPRTALKATALLLAVFAFFAAFLFLAPPAFAQAPDDGFADAAGLASGDPRVLVANIIRIFLGLLGTIATLIILYAGFIWMTAGGDEERVARAKQILSRGVIGLIIIVFAYAIASFIITRLVGALDGTGPGGSSGGSLDDSRCIGLSATCAAGALGSGIVDSHYPNRNATGIARNTRIAVTFKSPMDPASLRVGDADGTLAIIKSAGVVGTSNQFPTRYAQALTANDIEVSTADDRTFVFVQKGCAASTPDGCIGSPSESLFYTVAFRGGTDGVKKADGSAAFTGTFSSGYAWEFQVSTALDVTPPKITSALPNDGSADNARNSLVQVNFDEAVDPISVASGGLSVATASGNRVDGDALVGNAYRTAEFRTKDACGVNSCGETVYCLPANASVEVTVRAGNVPATVPAGGVIDMAGNALDGNGDGTQQGQPADNHDFAFAVGDDVDLVPPKINAQEPAFREGEIARDLKISATFSKLMSATSFTTDNARIVPGGAGAPVNYYLTVANISAAQGAAPTMSKADLNHDLFSADQPYAAHFGSGLRDLTQNCFFPGGGQSACTGAEPFCCNGVASAVQCAFL